MNYCTSVYARKIKVHVYLKIVKKKYNFFVPTIDKFSKSSGCFEQLNTEYYQHNDCKMTLFWVLFNTIICLTYTEV